MIKCLLLLSSLFRLIPSKQTSWIKPQGIPDGPQDFKTWSDEDIWSANDIQCIPSYHIVKCGEPHCGHLFHLKHLPRHYTKHHQITLKESSELKYRVLYPGLGGLDWADRTKKHEDKKQQRKRKEEQRRSVKRKRKERDKMWTRFFHGNKKPKEFRAQWVLNQKEMKRRRNKLLVFEVDVRRQLTQNGNSKGMEEFMAMFTRCHVVGCAEGEVEGEVKGGNNRERHRYRMSAERFGKEHVVVNIMRAVPEKFDYIKRTLIERMFQLYPDIIYKNPGRVKDENQPSATIGRLLAKEKYNALNIDTMAARKEAEELAEDEQKEQELLNDEN